MRTHLAVPSRSFATGLAAALLLLAASRPAAAQATSTDARWQAWLGCWEAADASGLRVIGSPTAPTMCAVPANGSAIELVTVTDGKVLDRTRVDASGARSASSKDGCTGWESATWSASASRVYLRSEYDCPGGLRRTSNGLIALSPRGEWLDVQSVAAGTNTGVRVVRMREATNLSAIPAEVTAQLPVRTFSVGAARIAAGSKLTVGDVVDASASVDSSVVQAWLVERDQGFVLNAAVLTTLADAGVPGSVTDVMLALSYPKVFALNPGTRTGEFRDADQVAPMSRGRALAVMGYDPMGYPMFGYDSYYRRCASPYYSSYSWAYSSYLAGCGYNGYGYNGYGYGYGYGSGYGWYPGSGPVVIVVKGSDNVPAGERPRVVNGRGYSQGGKGSSGSGSTSPGSGSSGSSSSGSSSSGASTAPAPARTAKPRP